MSMSINSTILRSAGPGSNRFAAGRPAIPPVIDENVFDWGRQSGASPRLVKRIRRDLDKGARSR